MVENERTKRPLASGKDRMSVKNLKIEILGFFGSEKVWKNLFLGFFAATF